MRPEQKARPVGYVEASGPSAKSAIPQSERGELVPFAVGTERLSARVDASVPVVISSL